MGHNVSELTPTTGVEFTGVPGGDLLDEKIAAQTLDALEHRGVVVFREAHATDDQLVAFARLLGEVVPLPMGSHPKYREIQKITRDASKSKLAAYREGTFHWHIDGSTDAVPSRATLLTAREISGDGDGDTEFANTYAAYEGLPEDEKRELDGLRVVHSFAASQLLVEPNPSEQERAAWDRNPSREHPLVWTHRNGRRSMLLGSTADTVVGRSPAEGRKLLDRLLEWSTQPQYVVRHTWQVGDLVVWDNTGMLHRALPYGPTSTRLMHRASLAGQEAVA